MNDRFRFRVWYKDLYSPEPKPKMIYGVERAYDCFCGDDEQIPASSFGVIIDDKEFIPMQCTGLKDKNDKLIYEGDIIKIEGNYCPIIWDKENARYDVVGYGEIAYLNYNEIEVIGNIHENKELLDE